MKPHILVMGAGLTGLTIASRLSAQGFRITLLDRGIHVPSSPHVPSAENVDAPDQTLNQHGSSGHLPIVIHGFQHATWNLLRELRLTSLITDTPAVPFEFVLPSHKLAPFQPVLAPSPLHTLIRLLLFKGLPWSNRWSLLKKVEQYWEGELAMPQNIDSQSVKTWLTMHQQSRQACEDIWDTLCFFFLGTKSEESSALYFTMLLRQCFLSTRLNHQTFIPALDEETLFLSALRSSLSTQSTNCFQRSTVSSFRCDGPHISSVRLNDGTTLTADIYVSALPRRTLIACLPEREQAKFAYFSNLSQLEDQTLVTTSCELSNVNSKPRLLLFSDPYSWMTIRQTPDFSSSKTHISYVTLLPHNCPDDSTQKHLETISFFLALLFKKSPAELAPINIRKSVHTFSASLPNTAPFRPLPKSPLRNLFVAGPWTDTGLPAGRESSLVSADLCVQDIIQHLAQRRIDKAHDAL